MCGKERVESLLHHIGSSRGGMNVRTSIQQPDRETRLPKQNATNATLSGPRSLSRMLGIFDAIARSPDGMSLAELSNVLGSPKSSLLTLLRPLAKSDYLVHLSGRYTLGDVSFALATNILSARKFGAVVRGLMGQAQKKCPETVILAVIDRAARTVTYSDVLESPKLIRYSVAAGASRPLFTSAAGQLLLAFQDEKWRHRYLQTAKLKALTKQSITDQGLLRKKLLSIRNAGISISVSEAVDGATGVAAPIYAADGVVSAALLIAGPSERYTREGRLWRETAVEFAQQISWAVGFP